MLGPKRVNFESANILLPRERDKNIRHIVETRYRLRLLPFLSALLMFHSELSALSNRYFASRTDCLLSVKVLKQRAETSPAGGFPLLPIHFDFEQGRSR